MIGDGKDGDVGEDAPSVASGGSDMRALVSVGLGFGNVCPASEGENGET